MRSRRETKRSPKVETLEGRALLHCFGLTGSGFGQAVAEFAHIRKEFGVTGREFGEIVSGCARGHEPHEGQV